MAYNSTPDTIAHILRVQELLLHVCHLLSERARLHDQSKLQSPEKECFDEFTPKLKACTYGSPEYKGFLDAMNVGLRHHYTHNTHHPEYWLNGIADMSLLDLIEMFCDWKAATERHADGSLTNSLRVNKDRFSLSDQLAAILANTQRELKW